MNAGSEDPNSLRNEVFSRVFDENWASVRRHIECVVDDDAEVTELVSEVFLVVWHRLNPKKPMDRTWLLRVAERALNSRNGRSTTRLTALDAVHQGMSGESEPPDRAERARVLRALGVLTPAERRIIMLTYWDGLAVGEIADLIRRSRSRVRITLHRAQRRLRAELGLEGASDGDG
ncbi:RNA polymerase sigma factor [Microbacterium sp. SD291]|uniref:RNA polymerase sigma factor n=1 Tax=Microbacterium sp. SD291 TaxID=2782007 RepID=UPI001A974400|nr:sigma-70 family RNA polymerase sigma factor [Microbacterium sp. SD291]MBO0981126.1 sigma-70 family RNA polymerase sigma factor [Microbacterium sp. SD291]